MPTVRVANVDEAYADLQRRGLVGHEGPRRPEVPAIAQAKPVAKAKPTKPRKAKPPLESEASFQKRVIQLAQLNGWRVGHFCRSLSYKGSHMTAVAADGAGFPDLVLVREDRLIFPELKRQDGKVSPKQKAWHDALAAVPGVTVCVWCPSDWDLIVELLT